MRGREEGKEVILPLTHLFFSLKKKKEKKAYSFLLFKAENLKWFVLLALKLLMWQGVQTSNRFHKAHFLSVIFYIHQFISAISDPFAEHLILVHGKSKCNKIDFNIVFKTPSKNSITGIVV